MGRAPCCDKANVKKGPWSPEEDAKLKSYIEQHGTGGNWIALPQKIGLKRCGKSCRLRWLNYLRPNIKHGGFSEEEDRIICSLYVSIGSRWSIIAAQLPGRTDNDIKNYWNTRLKKKLFGKQRKEHQATRRGSVLKKVVQMKREDATYSTGNSAIFSVNNDSQHIPYWPELLPNNPVAPQYSNDQASIRKLLIKLGGRFSGDEQALVNNEFTSTQPPDLDLDQQPAAYVPSSDTNPIDNLCKTSAQFTGGSLYDGCGNLQILQGQSSHMAELENYNHLQAYNDPRRLYGLEFLYGDEMANACSIATSADQSSELGEMASLICPPNYEGMLQGLTEQFADFNELRISGAQ